MRDYKIYSKIGRIIEARKSVLSKKEKDKNDLIYLGIFNYVLGLMKKEYLFILTNSYFNNTYRFWWLDYYCKSSYYRKRVIAVNSFVSLFEMIYENFINDPSFINFAYL